MEVQITFYVTKYNVFALSVASEAW